jgi:TolB-like protein
MGGKRSVDEGQEASQPTSDEVRSYLRTLLERSELDVSARNRRFLSYVVEETLEGRTDRIKAYNIALAAFGRTEDFDSLTDPIVRIEASRLRRSLEHYYLTAGKSDPIRIDIPKGSYIARFTYRKPEEWQEEVSIAYDPVTSPNVPKTSPFNVRWKWLILALAGLALLLAIALASVYTLRETGQLTAVAPAGAGNPSILVLPFQDTSSDGSRSFIARGLTYEIIGALTSFNDIVVFGLETSFNFASSESDPARLQIKPDFILSGSVQASDSRVRVSAILADGVTRQYLWSSVIERALTPAGFMRVQIEIAEQVAAAVAQPYGFIFERSAQAISSKPAESLVTYQCIVRFREYWRSYSEHDFDGIRSCLENTVAVDPAYAQGYASLALLYVNAYRTGFGRSKLSSDPLHRAADLAGRAIALDPDLADGYLAQSLTLWFLHDTEASIRAAERGLGRRPNNTALMTELGLRYALRANWDDAMPLIKKAYERNPGSSSGYHFATFLYAYMTGDYERALNAASKVQTPGIVYGALARASAYGQLNDRPNANREVAEILKIDSQYADRLADDLANRNFDPMIVRALTEGLVKAGLQVRAPPSAN